MKLTLLLFLLAWPCIVLGAEHEWYWVKAGNNSLTGWDVSTGKADVVIKNGRFTATLFANGSDATVQITLSGSIASNKLVVKETVQNTDYSGSTYTGTRTLKKWEARISGTTGVETITLSNDLGLIGISKNLTN